MKGLTIHAMMKQLILTSRKAIISILSLLLCVCGYAQYEPSFSTAGFYQTENSGRTVYSMNVAWRFFKGAVKGAEAVSFDDSKWEVVSTPHGLEYLPTEASGCINYQGEAWYRKHVTPDAVLKGKKLFLHFEAWENPRSISTVSSSKSSLAVSCP
jgi:beta-galactosidase